MSRILLIRHCFHMCILYGWEGRKLDNLLGYYVTFVEEYCIVLFEKDLGAVITR